MGKKDIVLLSIRTKFGEARCVRSPSSIQYILFHPEYSIEKVMKVLTLDPSIPLETQRNRFRTWVEQLKKQKFIKWE